VVKGLHSREAPFPERITGDRPKRRAGPASREDVETLEHETRMLRAPSIMRSHLGQPGSRPWALGLRAVHDEDAPTRLQRAGHQELDTRQVPPAGERKDDHSSVEPLCEKGRLVRAGARGDGRAGTMREAGVGATGATGEGADG
jgi:NAD-dependent DNA ligase